MWRTIVVEGAQGLVEPNPDLPIAAGGAFGMNMHLLSYMSHRIKRRRTGRRRASHRPHALHASSTHRTTLATAMIGSNCSHAIGCVWNIEWKNGSTAPLPVPSSSPPISQVG